MMKKWATTDQILEDQAQRGFCVDNVVQSDNVDVLEALQKRHFPDRGAWRPLLVLQPNLLQRNHLSVDLERENQKKTKKKNKSSIGVCLRALASGQTWLMPLKTVA